MGRRIAVIVAALALIAVAVTRVAVTVTEFGATNDECAHIDAGYAWFHGLHNYHLANPPLPRVIFAMPFRNFPALPPVEAIHSGTVNWHKRGTALLEQGDYLENLGRARRGNLFFLVILLASTFVWARHLFGDGVALAALALLSTIPQVLGNAGLATTDTAGAAALPLALYALTRWLEASTWPRTLALGGAIGFGLLAKYSFPLFFGSALVILILFRPRTPHMARAAAAIALAAFVVWAGYRFELGTIASRDPLATGYARLAGDAWMAYFPMPAPMFLGGLFNVTVDNHLGFLAYCLGRWSYHGWWWYFPVVFFFKTPLPFLALSTAGIVLFARRGEWRLAVLPLAVMLPLMAGSINLGVRHALPIYPLLALPAGYAVVNWRPRILPIALAAWQIVASVIIHPNYFGWFNELAGKHPERIAVESNLDWGQDIVPLARKCRELGIQRIGLAVTSASDLDRIGMPPTFPIDLKKAPHGWVAISASSLVYRQHETPGAFAWLSKARRVIPVGSSIKLYEMP